MKLRAGDQLVRFEVITPANFGAAGGAAAVDRPTVWDPELELPYLPDSALKGVIAGHLGNIDEADPRNSAGREALFGSPDRPGHDDPVRAWGRASRVIFGNGEPLCFPHPVEGGGVCRIVPASVLGRITRLPGAPDPGGAVELLRRIEQAENRAVGWPGPPALEGAPPLRWETGRQATSQAPALVALVARLAGRSPEELAPLVIVAAPAARRLWRTARELRTLTALEAEGKVVASGSLRTVEMVSAGTVFVALVSYQESKKDAGAPELPDHFQVGAWEGQGFGFLTAAAIADRTPAAPEAATGKDDELPAQPDPADLMRTMHRAVSRLSEREPRDAKLAAKAKAAVSKFGGRAQFSGLEAAVAFSLAQAKPWDPRPGIEARAHRWLLETLLSPNAEGGEDGASGDGGRAEGLIGWLEQEPFTPGRLELRRAEIMGRWHWLRRFAELGLTGAESASPEQAEEAS